MSIFDTNYTLPYEEIFNESKKVVCDTITPELLQTGCDSTYVLRMIGWRLTNKELWYNRNQPMEEQINKKIFGIKVKRAGIESGWPYYKVSLCWAEPFNFHTITDCSQLNPSSYVDIYVGINGIINEPIR